MTLCGDVPRIPFSVTNHAARSPRNTMRYILCVGSRSSGHFMYPELTHFWKSGQASFSERQASRWLHPSHGAGPINAAETSSFALMVKPSYICRMVPVWPGAGSFPAPYEYTEQIFSVGYWTRTVNVSPEMFPTPDPVAPLCTTANRPMCADLASICPARPTAAACRRKRRHTAPPQRYGGISFRVFRPKFFSFMPMTFSRFSGCVTLVTKVAGHTL